MSRELLREHVLGPGWNTAALAKHDAAIQNFLVARYDHERKALTDAGLAKAVAAYQAACRTFERDYRVEEAA